MPRYDYQIINEDGSEGDIVEITHSIKSPPLSIHPETGQRVRKVFAVSAPTIKVWDRDGTNWNFKDSIVGKKYAKDELRFPHKKSRYTKKQLEAIWHPRNDPKEDGTYK